MNKRGRFSEASSDGGGSGLSIYSSLRVEPVNDYLFLTKNYFLMLSLQDINIVLIKYLRVNQQFIPEPDK